MAYIPTPNTPEFDQAASDAFYEAYGVRVAPYELSSMPETANGNMSAEARQYYIDRGQTPFEWMGAKTPEGMSFTDYADYAYSHGLAGQDYNTGLTRVLNDYGYMVPLVAGAAFGGLAAAGAGAAGGTGAATGAALTPEAYMASAGLTPGVFEGAAFTLPQGLGAAAGAGAELAGPTYQELGYTGLEAGQMGPTYAELGYTGLNNAEAIAAADAASAAANGMSLSDIAKYANTARQGLGLASTVAKMVGGGNSGAQTTGGLDLSKLANALKPTNTFNPINLQQIESRNPFFGSMEGTLGGEDIYNVSGTKLANALRNK